MTKRLSDAEEGICGFFLEKKKRLCRMKRNSGMKYCPHHSHLGTDHDERKGPRIPCPLDSSHFCYRSKLQQHLKKCNAKEKKKPEYFISGVNSGDSSVGLLDKINLGDVPDDELLEFIKKIERIYDECEFPVHVNNSSHPLLQAEIEKQDDGIATLKHLKQQAALLSIMQDHDFLLSGTCFVEFGAGKGQLMYWIIKSVEEKEQKAFVLVDKSAQRHKSDNKLRDCNLQIERIRIDIQNLYLGKVQSVQKNINKIVGVSKHLCGAATDLSLKCMMETLKSNKDSPPNQPLGLVMALCCHHRCSWSSFVGKDFMETKSIREKEFKMMCCLASWATCGPKKSSADKNIDVDSSEEDEKDEDIKIQDSQPLNRYSRLGLSHEMREEIGKKCKRLIDLGRVHYVAKNGFDTKLVTYIDSSVSLENIALVGIRTKS